MPIDLSEIKDWLTPVSLFIGIISTSSGIWLALREFRLKLNAEKRLAESARVETDIRLLTHFTEILEIATGRRKDVVYSKEVAEKLIGGITFDPNEEGFDFRDLEKKIKDATLLNPVVGQSSIDAAFASITTLAERHDVLLSSAKQALQSAIDTDWNVELATRYLGQLEDSQKKP